MDQHEKSFDDNTRKEFLTFLDHELRNPLAVILSSVELLQIEALSKNDQPALVATIDKQVHIITNILDDLLNPQGLLQKNIGPTKQPTGPDEVLRSAEHTASVLLVDDNEIAAEALKRLLESEGYHVSLANNGADAIYKAKELHPNVIILDIGLPDIDGYEVIHTLREEKNFSPLYIALTGYGQADDKARAQEAGFHAHLTKPIGLKEIKNVLTTLASRSVAHDR